MSTEEQADRETVKGQLEFLRRFCDLQQLPIAGEYIDDGVSGAIPLENRPEGRRLLDDAAAGRFGSVLIYRLSRLGRKLTVILSAHEALDGAGVAIRSATEPIDTGTPVGRFVFQLLAGIAELDRESIREQMTIGRDRAAFAGKYTGGPVPLGYDVGSDRRLVPTVRSIPQLGISEAEFVRDLFQPIAAGSTALAEARRLNALGLQPVKRFPPTKRHPDGKVLVITDTWSPARLANIIHNPMYKGEGQFDSKAGTITTPAPALVDAKTWGAAQAALTRNRSLSKKNAKWFYLLRGLITCGDCGMGFSGWAAGKAGHKWPCYRCNGQITSARPDPEKQCGAKLLGANRIESLVWADCGEWIRNPGERLAEAQRELRERLTRVAGMEGRQRQLIAQMAEKDGERERVLGLYRRGRITTAEAEKELDAIARETTDPREMLEALRTQEAIATAQEAHLTDVASGLARLRDRVEEIEVMDDPDAKAAAKREIIELLASRITVHTEGSGRAKRAEVTATYAFDTPRLLTVDSANVADECSDGGPAAPLPRPPA